MKRHIAISFIILSLGLSACSAYHTPGGRTRLADPAFCNNGNGLCPLLVGAAVVGVAAFAVSN